MKSPKQLLLCAADLLESDGGIHWCRGALAKTSKRGKIVEPKNPTAWCWCAVGALEKCLDPGQGTTQPELKTARDAAETIIRMSLTTYNDARGRRYIQVVAVLRKAAATLP